MNTDPPSSTPERYRTLVAAMDDGYCLIEVLFDDGRPVDYRFIETNPAFNKQTGLHDVDGKTMLELAPLHEAHWFELYGAVATTGEAIRFIDEAKALGRWFDAYAMRVGDAGLHQVAVLFTDITAKKAAEDELQRLAFDLARADRQRNEFLATLSHELRNPLAPLLTGLQLMKKAHDRPDLMDRTRAMMERQLLHLVHLVDDLLDIGRVTSGKIELERETIDIGSIVRIAGETAAPRLAARRHAFEMSLPPSPVFVHGDITRLAQVLSNLLGNSAKYTPVGGRVTLVAEQQGSDVVVAVTDNGIGIAAESLPEVFEMYTQLGRDADSIGEGLGIGLALVRRLVELHGGTVTAASAGEGRGSTFTVRLPVAARHEPA